MKKLCIYSTNLLLVAILGLMSNKVVAQTITVSDVPDILCANESFTLSYSSTGLVFNTSNVFTVELSAADGSYPGVSIGTFLSSDIDGTIYCTIPTGATFSNSYTVRVSASNSDLGAFTGSTSNLIDINCTTRNYYWVGGTGNWSDLSHWEYTTDDVTFTAATELPLSTDNVLFDENSFPSGGQITLDVEAYCNDMYWDPLAGTNNPIIYSNSSSLNIYGDFELASGVYNDLYYVYFYPDKYNIYLNFGDNLHQANPNTTWKQRYYLNNSFSYTLDSDIDANRLYLYGGIFDTNDFDITLEYRLYSSSTFNAGTSTISTAAASLYGTFNAYNATVWLHTTDYYSTPYIYGSNDIFNLTIGPGICDVYDPRLIDNLTLSNGGGMNIDPGSIQTVTSTFVAQGLNRGQMAIIKSTSPGSQATIDVSGAISVSADYVDITDNFIDDGGGGIFMASNAIDGGNNTGWDFSSSPLSPLDYYWINGTGDWSDVTHWQISPDGGSTFEAATEGPSQIDDIFFTGNSFPSGGRLTLDQSYSVNNMTWEPGSGTSHPEIYGDWDAYFTIKGDLTMDDGVSRRIYRLIFDSSNGSNNIYMADNYNAYGDTFFEGGGNWNLQGDFYGGASTFIREGTLNTNDHTITFYYGMSIESDLAVLNFGSSDVYFYEGFYNYATTPTINPGTSTFYFGNDWGSETQIYSPYGTSNFNNVYATSNNSLRIRGTNTFNMLTADPASIISLANGETQTVTGTLNLVGSRSQFVSVVSDSPGTPATLFVSGATVNADFINVTDNIIDNGLAALVPATNALDNGGNTGWSFSALVPLDYRWIGGTGNWNDASHWESSPVGFDTYSAATDAPAYTDNIFFTTNSFPSGGTLTLNNTYQCNDMTWEAGSGGGFPVLYSDYGNELVISGSLKLVDGVTRSLYRINFKSDAIGNTIDLADNLDNGGDIDFDGTGEWTLMSDLKTTWLNVRGGTFNSNDHALNIDEQIYLGSNYPGTINLGSSEVNLSRLYCDAPSLTFNAQTSTFNFITNGGTGSINGGFPVSLNDVNIKTDFELNNAYSFNNLTIDAGVELTLEPGVTQTINGSFTALGTRSKMITINTYSPGSAATLLINTVLGTTLSVDYLALQDNILDNGSAFTTTEIASNSLDNGGNTGWDFSTNPLTSLDYYWIGGSGNWSDVTHWVTTDGGSTQHSDSPGPIDNVFFTSNSFPSGGTVTLDAPSSCNDMTWNDGSFNPTIYGNYDNELVIGGNLTIADGVNRNLQSIEFNSSTTNLIDLGDNRFESSNMFFRGGGTWNLLGTLEADYIGFYEGTLNTNDQLVDVYQFQLQGNDPITMNFSNSELHSRYISNYASNVSGDNGTSHVFLEDGGQIYGNPLGFFDLTIEGEGYIYGDLDVSNSLTIEPGGKLMINPYYTVTVGNLIANGTRPSPVTIQSTDEGIQSTISQASGTVSASNIILKDNNAVGGATFNATDAYDRGNVTGWNITAISPLDYYWMAPSGDWSDRNSWSLTDGSNVIPGTAPGPADNIFVTTNSPIASGGIMNLDIPAECNDMTWSSGLSGASISGDYDTPLTIHGSLISASGVQLNMDQLYFDTDASNTIDIGSNTGNNYMDIVFRGSGDWTLASDFLVGYINFQGGSFYTNGHTVEVDYIDAYSNSGSGMIDFGSSDIYTGGLYKYNVSANTGTSTVYLNDYANVYYDWNFNDVEIDGETSFYYADNSFNTLTIQPGSTVRFYDGSTQIINQLNAVGERSRPITIKSTSDGYSATISKSSGVIDAEYLILQDNDATGGAQFSAQNSIDNGNVSGWYITSVSPRNYYWVGGSGSWSEASTHWVSSDGGTNFYTESPGPLDNVFFTANSFTSTGTLTLDNPVSVDNMDWTGNTSSVSISDGGDENNALTIGGSLILANGVSRDFEELHFDSDKTSNTIFMADNLHNSNFVYFYGSGDWSLMGDFEAYYTAISEGTFYTNDFDFTSQYIRLYDTNVSYWGSSDVFTWRFYNYLDDPNNFNSETSVFHFDELQNNYITGNSRFYITLFNGNTYVNGSNIFFNSSLTMGTLQLDGAQSFNSLSIDGGTTLSLLEGTTHTISAALDLNGDVDNPVVLNSFSSDEEIEPGAATLSMPPTGVVSANFVHLKNNTATGGATFDTSNSSDFGNVTGWNGLLTGQTIDFGPLDDIPLSDGSFDVSATSSSSLGVTFEIASGSATISGTSVTPSASGLVGIRATQTGDATYGNALPVTRYVHIDATSEPNEMGNMKAAKLAIGQPDFVTTNDIYTDITVPNPTQVAVSSSGALAIANGTRVMIWNTIPNAPNVPANVVLGHTDFNTDISNSVSASTFAGNVYSLAFAGDQLIVADEYRVLIWNTLPTANGAPANVVIGQPDFTSTKEGVSQTLYAGDAPICVAPFDDGGSTKLLVVDGGNSRALIYNSIPTSNGAPADIVIGQGDFISDASGSGSWELNFPIHGTVSPDGKIIIADYGNNRVLIYNSIPSSNAVDADVVLGQVDFGSSESGVGPTNFYGPTGVSVSRSGRLAVSDYLNNRVLIYNAIPGSSSTTPDFVLGQPDQNSNTINYNSISARSMYRPIGVDWDTSENLFVSDISNSRVLLYGAADLEGPSVTPTYFDQPINLTGTNQITSFATSDRSGVAGGTVFFGKVESLDPNTDPQFYEEMPLTDVGNGTFEIDFSDYFQSFNPFVGLEYFVELYDNLGNVTSTSDNIQTLPIYYPNGIEVNGFGVGNATENYRIMAVPLDLDNAAVSSVFSDVLGGSSYDNTKLRIFEYPAGPANDYTEATGTTQLQPGTGYFALLASSPSNAIMPSGATSFITSNDGSTPNNVYEFTINLVSGWNLIGNPFPHDIVWSDVVALSGITNEVDAPQVYNGTSYAGVTSIGAGEGAFVNASSNITLRIPALFNQAGGRIASPRENKNPLADTSWEVLFKSFKEGSQEEYTLGGFGMELSADYSKDQFDVLNPPSFGKMKVVNFNHPEYIAPSFKKDIKETSEEGMWEFSYTQVTDEVSKHEIHWDNSYFGKDAPDLYLVDKTHFVTVNMKEESSYTFSHGGKTEFEVYYGENAWEQIAPKELISQSPFPNPFSNEVNFTLGLPRSGENYQVEIRIFDSVGKTVRYISQNDISAGYNSIIWDGLNTDGRILPSGLYAYSIHIKGLKIDSVSTGKLIKR